MNITSDPRVNVKYTSYPDHIKEKIFELRSLIIKSAEELGHISQLEETLKWGEPSFLCKGSSTLRMDWKSKNPQYIALYFKCTSKLIPSFKKVFGNKFIYEKDRAIYLPLEDDFNSESLKTCIKSALQYHKIKHLGNLGLSNLNS